ncbi:MAG: hypothetical protein K8J08_18495 [Thermoanaerobaculia bacterium]|nr:hypothetical protein [Thermoanaerobaculia bacterium]
MENPAAPRRRLFPLRRTLVASFALGVALWAVACGSDAGDPADDAGISRVSKRPVTIAAGGDFSGPNELLTSLQLDHEVRSNLFLHLVQEQPDYREHPPTFAPQLAESYDWSEDHLQLTFHLRPDVTWSDGVPVTADDVRWTWQAQTSAEIGWTYGFVKESIGDVEVVDPHTVTFHFDHVYANQLLDANEGFILPRHAWSKLPFAEWSSNANWFQENLVVSGPFTVESWTPQQETVLVRNPAYFRTGFPRLERVVLRVLPDESSRLRQFLTGEVDVLRGVPVDRVDEVKAKPDLEIVEIDSRQYNFIAWNGLRAPFSDPAVRRALTQAIDRQELVDTLYGGLASIAISPFPATVWAHDATLTPWPYDPDAAKEQLAALGWTDSDGDGLLDRDGLPFSFELSTNTGNQLRRDALLLLQEQLRRVGIDARPTFLEIQALIAANDGHEYDATLAAWGIDTSLDVRYSFHSDEIDGGSNFVSFSNPEADQLMDDIAGVSDPIEAKPYYDRLQQILHQQQPYTFLWEPPNLIGLNRRIEDAHPNALLMLYDLENWRVRN